MLNKIIKISMIKPLKVATKVSLIFIQLVKTKKLLIIKKNFNQMNVHCPKNKYKKLSNIKKRAIHKIRRANLYQ